jgi:tetratricopeptide (TPR) repeat protein
MIEIEPILQQIRSGDPVGAAYRLEQALGGDAPGRAFYEAGSVALSRREDLGEEALRFARLAFAEAVERDPDLGEAHHDLATTMRELGMSEDAVAHYRRALELLPDDVDCLIGLGAALCDAGKLDDGIRTLRRAAEAHPDSGPAHANLGVALEVAGLDEQAAGAYAKAVARFDAGLLDAKDDEVAENLAARRRWARIQHAELLERLERWPQALVEYRRLYEEEQAIAEAEAAAEEEENGDEDEEDGASMNGEYPIGDDDVPQPDGASRAKLVAEEPDGHAPDDHARDADDRHHDHDHDDHDHDDHDHDHDHDDHDDHDHDVDDAEGRQGLERLFARLVQIGRIDLAYVLLDDLGGELADARTRANYAIYDPGDGLPTIMVEHWDSGERERLDPAPGSTPPGPTSRSS